MRHRLTNISLNICVVLAIGLSISIARFCYRLYEQKSMRLSCRNEFRALSEKL